MASLPDPTPSPSLAERADDVVVRTRFVSPAVRQHVVPRPRLDRVLERVVEHPLTILKADAGYGKTTAIAAWLAGAIYPHVWYNVGDVEPDPHLFLWHLVEALGATLPGVEVHARQRLETGDRSPRVWGAVIDRLSNELLDRLQRDTVLVLDDYDRVNRPEINAIVERFVETMPPKLHVVVTARTMPSLRARARWRASSELLEITRGELAFNIDEVESLLSRRLPQPVPRDLARAVAAETEGWPIALQMLSDGLGEASAWAVDSLLQRIPGPAELLFEYLAEEVFLRQTPDIRRFLAESSCLRRLDAEACNEALGIEDSATILRFLEQGSLFVSHDGGYRYHALFADFLHRRPEASAARRELIHRRAAAYYSSKANSEEAVHHLIAAGAHSAAASQLARIAERMTSTGRHQALAALLGRLPDEVVARSGELLLARAETQRLASRYPDALPLYAQARERFRLDGDVAGEVRTLRAQALVYLDTVQPARAEPLLREALHKSRGDRSERAALYALLAENKLNSGNLRHAERMYRAVHRVLHANEPVAIDARVYLRQGRFVEARRLMEANLDAERQAPARSRAPRSHREAAAVLSWVELLVGDAAAARQHATEALQIGLMLGSPVIECLSLGRLGLAWLAGRDFDSARARGYCDEALKTAERFGIPRFRVEPLMGLAIVAGLERRPADAARAASEALDILRDAGDEHVLGVVQLALGGALVMCESPDAERQLMEAEQHALACGDRFVPALAALWLAVSRAREHRGGPAMDSFVLALQRARAEEYDFLFEGTALLAPKDIDLWRPLLRRAQTSEQVADYARRLAREVAPTHTPASASAAVSTDTPSSAPLFIQTLGPFRAWRRGQEIERREWPRERALHLFQLLVCHRGHALHRDRIVEILWPDSSPSTAATGLRVALSALRNALEPNRQSGTDGRFVRREGDAIRLAMDAGIRVDVDEFSRMLKAARALESGDREPLVAAYEAALGQYRGEFLEENPYARWADEERQRRRTEFLAGAERFAALLVQLGDAERAVRWAEAMLQHDPLWEAAYAILMEARWQQGNRALAVRAFNRCKKRLRDGLGVAPSARVIALMERLTRGG